MQLINYDSGKLHVCNSHRNSLHPNRVQNSCEKFLKYEKYINYINIYICMYQPLIF
jgi:hypothetical protein